ncbi:sensor histidine kinase [Sandaracinus amylolyticus]|uniref:histidine kinase n=1 Tax=Sandaracinus amylolyticus TaxID=927083 RepID=A0A0F6YJW5_9BACT|nr:ATP-binding protein [Sandaracinus amylolyticus]AKF08578.1 sensory box sensor histidine kinase [Sandaracinus amylolyticus]
MSERVADPFGRHAASRVRGLGLRAQITLALIAALGISVTLVAIAIDRLASRALEQERERAAQIAAEGAAAMIGRADAPEIAVDRVEHALMRPESVIGLAIVGDDGSVRSQRGEVGHGVIGEARLADGVVRVWVSSAIEGDGAGTALVRLVVLYAVITSLAMLVLCYALLTRLIVTPVEALTRASEQLAAGRGTARSPVQGAAEVQRLALSFNAMAEDLRRERAALVERLADLERATKELRATQDSLVRSEKLASVGRLAAGVAHEIGNPLAAILGLLELVRGGGLEPAEEAEFLRRIQHETERIHRIIRDLLDYSRAGADAPIGRADLGEVVASAVHLVAPQKDLRRITIEQRVPEELPRVRGEADALTQLVLNLLLNAADAIEGEGSITITIAEHDDQIALTVDDTGPGIAPEVRDRLFEPFVTTKPTGSGTGLGLAVCWTIVERVGGTISAEDAPSGGARFVVRLQRA